MVNKPSAEQPGYLTLLTDGLLAERAKTAYLHLKACDVCPRNCGADRLAGELGACQTGARALISSYGAHHGEERPLSGWRGSGTIFFGGCNQSCKFCQNADISQFANGRAMEAKYLAGVMLDLQTQGCHNINFVSPSHVVPQILEAVLIAAHKGLTLPLVYNSGGYDSLAMLVLLDGVVDIYMPDMKYSDEGIARKYSGIMDYPRVNQEAVKAMHRQVGDLQLNQEGLAYRGLLVRHLVLPHGLAGSKDVFSFLAEKVSKNTYLNVMAQYHPAYQARAYPELSQGLDGETYHQALADAKEAGLTRLDH